MDTIASVLEDIIVHNILIDDIVLAILAIFVLILCIKKKVAIIYGYLIEIGLLIISGISFASDARVVEYAGWYLYDTDAYDKLMFENYIPLIITILIFMILIIMVIISIKRRRHSDI